MRVWFAARRVARGTHQALLNSTMGIPYRRVKTMRPTPRTRTVRDSHGDIVGISQGLRPDPLTGRWGLEIQLLPDAGDALGTGARTLRIDDRNLAALRRDEIVIDLSLDELKRLGPPEPTARPKRPRPQHA